MVILLLVISMANLLLYLLILAHVAQYSAKLCLKDGLKKHPNLHLVTASGESSPFLCKAVVEITLGSQKLLHDVLLADVKNDSILGMDFLTKHRCDMFLSKNHLLLNGEKIACFLLR